MKDNRENWKQNCDDLTKLRDDWHHNLWLNYNFIFKLLRCKTMANGSGFKICILLTKTYFQQTRLTNIKMQVKHVTN